MERRLVIDSLAIALVVIGALSGCSPGTVRINAAPVVGERAVFRYEIDATITRALDGEEPTTTRFTSTLLADQEVVAITEDGVEADITLRRDGTAPRSARVILDRTGAIRSIELVAGLESDELGLAELGSLLPPVVAPPTRRLAPGERWTISEGAVDGHGRLTRLGIIDDAKVAVVRTSVTEAIDDAVAGATSSATLRGELRSVATAAYDLADGSARRSSARSRGLVTALIEPPPWIDAVPAQGTISYDIRVEATRLS
ncbi:MAG: hypothetical protein WD691_04550 [Acidimicrobiales bacterium]